MISKRIILENAVMVAIAGATGPLSIADICAQIVKVTRFDVVDAVGHLVREGIVVRHHNDDGVLTYSAICEDQRKALDWSRVKSCRLGRHDAVLLAISNSKEPISNPDICEALRYAYTAESISTSLAHLRSKGLIEPLGQNRHARWVMVGSDAPMRSASPAVAIAAGAIA